MSWFEGRFGIHSALGWPSLSLTIVAAREGVSLNSYVANVLAENVGRVG